MQCISHLFHRGESRKKRKKPGDDDDVEINTDAR